MKRSLLSGPSQRGAAANRRYLGSAAIGALFSLVLAVSGCVGTLDPGVGNNPGTGGSGGGGGTACQDTVFMTNCAFCHGTASPGGGLDLQAANPASRLLGVMSGAGSTCPGSTYLNPSSNPATGVFIDKITKDQPVCGGSRMPIGPPLSTADLTCLTTWATGLTTGSP